ncbi:E3 ubiquitin-protein ligase MSL2-like [Ylistrum balloti]|uniref:E3 ubiquitin-protein ligase MSL2-like n=1 Tax=Ylistrum balloti TaxID=509963 RepID=UPI002905E94D|nr:E3 ubiquitin-protein ligase MSL2-like [Ylistrum balloti]
MNALNIYLTTCRYVMQADFADRESWSDLYRYLPFLRQALSCCVCRNLIVRPMGPVHNVCQHFVCFACIGGKMKLKPQCSWCKHHDEFKENTQLRLAVICFKKLCEYISDSPIGTDLHIQARSPNGETNSLTAILQEALDFEDDFTLSSSLPPSLDILTKHNLSPKRSSKSKSPSKCVKRSDQSHNSSTEKSDSPKLMCSIIKDKSTLDINPEVSCCSTPGNKVEHDSELQLNSTSQSDESIEVNVTDTDTSTDSKPDSSLKRKHDSDFDCSNRSILFESSILTSGSQGSRGDNSQLLEPDTRRQTLGPSSDHEQKDLKTCKCGRGGTNSRLTCLGQRCPCYINRLPCIGCKCKGCRNPRKIEHDRLKIVKTEKTADIESIVNSENMFVDV